ncbi:MAG: trigger factor, partial [Armatimonadaceae bacterium]
PARVQQRTVETVVPDAYRDAVQEQGVEPFGQADFELVGMPEDGTVVFKATVPLKPVVTLGPYKSLAVERRRLIVDDAEIDQQIEALRVRKATYTAVDGAESATGDMLLVDLTAVVEGRDLPELAVPQNTLIEVGKNIPELDSGLVGLTAGVNKTITATYPDSFPDASLRGRTGTFTVDVKEVRPRGLPDVDDAFVQSVHPTAKTLDELRLALKEALENAADEMADNEVEVKIVSQIVETSQIHFPEVLLQAEVQAEARQLEERLQEQNITVEDYLRAIGKTTDDVLGEMSVGASARIRNSLVLGEIARAESIVAEESDIEAKIAQRAEQLKVSPSAMRAFAEKNNQIDRFRDQALTEKILNFLKGSATITSREVTGTELRGEAASTEAEPAKPKARKSKKAETAEAVAEPADTAADAASAPVVKRRRKAADSSAE